MRTSIICTLLLVVTCGAISAQERTIDEPNYNDRMNAANEYRLKENYREKRVYEYCQQPMCVWKAMSIDVTEWDHPHKRRSYTIDTQRGQTTPTTEFISVNGTLYVKRPNMDWRVEVHEKPSWKSPPAETIKIEFKDLGTEISGSESMTVLSRVAHFRSEVNGKAGESIQTIKSWIGQDGRLKRQEYWLTDPTGRTSRLSISYEVDRTIRIEIPIK
jgi:hypothetical protein